MPDNYSTRVQQLQLLWVAQSAINLGSVATTPYGRTQLHRQTQKWLSRQVGRVVDNWS